MDNLPDWLKSKGYLHISPSLKIGDNWRMYKRQIEDIEFVSKYAFYPLIHSFIRERKYKKADCNKHSTFGRSHSHTNKDTLQTEKMAKLRPLHYASHFDALIYGYYAKLLNEKYEQKLKLEPGLSESVTAYRKHKINKLDDRGKSTIHFAKEVFEEVKNRTSLEKEIAVLTFDIKGFFSSLDHCLLKSKWAFIIDKTKLPDDHFNVFKSCTNFNYILLDNLRKSTSKSKRKSGFDERKLAEIRRNKGFKCFFESNEDFRKHIKDGKLKIYNNPFRRIINDGKKIKIGIPQGLPISAVLANMYLYDFDSSIVSNLVNKKDIFYRRYSDDIIVLCSVEDINYVKNYIENLIQESELKISTDKTETFIFKYDFFNKAKDSRITSFKLNTDGSFSKNSPLIYLGFEFRGYNVVVKSTNLAKYYRRLISIVKRRANRAKKIIEKDPAQNKVIFVNQIKKLYNNPLSDLDSDKKDLKQKERNKTILVPNERGDYKMISQPIIIKKKNSNYMGYIKRCVEIFGTSSFQHQVRKRKHIVFTAIKRHLNN